MLPRYKDIRSHSVNWRKVSEMAEERIPEIKSKITECLDGEDRVGFSVSLNETGIWNRLQFWCKPVKKNRAVANDHPPRYFKLTSEEEDLIGSLIKRLPDLLPDFELERVFSESGLITFHAFPLQLPMLSKSDLAAVKKARKKCRNLKLSRAEFKGRIEQLSHRRPDLVLTFKDDIPKIAKELGMSIRELQKYISRG